MVKDLVKMARRPGSLAEREQALQQQFAVQRKVLQKLENAAEKYEQKSVKIQEEQAARLSFFTQQAMDIVKTRVCISRIPQR